MKTYIFHTSVPGTGRRWRKIERRADPDADYPRIVERVGDLPLQYPT